MQWRIAARGFSRRELSRTRNRRPASLSATVTGKLYLHMNLFESWRFLWRSTFWRASFMKPAATSTAFVSRER